MSPTSESLFGHSRDQTKDVLAEADERTREESMVASVNYCVKMLDVVHTKTHLNLRICDPMQDNACVYFVENSSFTPKKPDVILFSGNKKPDRSILGVARWSCMYSKDVMIGLGDAGSRNENGPNILWEKMTCTSGWTYSEHHWRYSVDHENREYVWKRTHREGVEPEHNSWSSMNFKLLDAQTNEVVATYASYTLKAWTKFGRFTFRQDCGQSWQLMVLLTCLALIEKHRRRDRVRSTTYGGGSCS
ncbi:hypothetical protein DV738_g5631, partial [Chaetothyriales sp. CBS 135597]